MKKSKFSDSQIIAISKQAKVIVEFTSDYFNYNLTW